MIAPTTRRAMVLIKEPSHKIEFVRIERDGLADGVACV